MIKAKDFQRTSRCLNLGDFVFAPQPVNFKSQEFKDAAKKIPDRRQPIRLAD